MVTVPVSQTLITSTNSPEWYHVWVTIWTRISKFIQASSHCTLKMSSKIFSINWSLPEISLSEIWLSFPQWHSFWLSVRPSPIPALPALGWLRFKFVSVLHFHFVRSTLFRLISSNLMLGREASDRVRLWGPAYQVYAPLSLPPLTIYIRSCWLSN